MLNDFVNDMMADEDRLLLNDVLNDSNNVPLVAGVTWHIISAKWFRKWSDFISSGYKEDLSPGRIENGHLLNDNDELVKGIVEKEDFLFVTITTANQLYDKFTVDTEIRRKVIRNNELSLECSILLYPLRLEIYVISDPGKANPSGTPSIRYALEPRQKVERFFELLVRDDFLPEGSWRLWIRTTPKSNIQEAEHDLLSDDDAKVTEAVAEKDGHWLLLKKKRMDTLKICDLPSFTGDDNDNCVEIIYEYVKNYSRNYFQISTVLIKESEFPRYSIQYAWRGKLKVGHVVDALNSKKKDFLEAKIIEISTFGEIKVHFLGFDDTSDDTVVNDESGIMPLYSKSLNWRSMLRENDYVEVRCTKFTSNGKWITTTVNAIKEGQVKVYVDLDDDAIDKDDRIELEYDEIKKQHYTIVDMDSEGISQQGTHLKKRENSLSLWRSGETKKVGYQTYDWSDRNTKSKPIANGAVGLANLGNTCFMNSILQCLSNTVELSNIFNNDRHKSQINRDNPLGHGGKLVEVYSELIKDIWSNNYTKVSPYNFKHTIGEFKPQFSGYQQQDSQEFMSFLLDGLHEDLNRIKKKPYVKTLESHGRSDDIIAREALRRYLLRNDSEIIDLCFGQLRSHVICTNCGHESTTYDSYSSLSLPIPTNRNKPITVIVHLLPYGSLPIKVQVEVSSTDNIYCLKKKVLQKLMQSGAISPNSEADNSEADNISEENVMDISNFDEKIDTDREDNPNKKKRLYNSATLPKFYNIKKESSKKYLNKDCRDDDRIFSLNMLDDEDRYDQVVVKMFQMEDENLDFVDLYLAEEKDMSSSWNKVVSHGLIGRVPRTNDTTNRNIYDLSANVIDRFIDTSKMSLDDSEPIFTLYFADTYDCDSVKDEIPCDNDRFTIYQRNGYSRSTDTEIVIVLKKTYMHVFDTSSTNSYSSIVNPVSPENCTSKLNIQKCIEKYTEKEQMNEEEVFFCSKCKQLKAPIKKLDLWSTPDVLILHLKRFEYTPGQYFVHRDKITDFVEYPIENLDLTNFVLGSKDAPPIYDLYAVSEHSGGLGGGHYTATCMNPLNKKWYSFNDSLVNDCEPQKAVTELAYLLFYKRKSSSPHRWGGLMPLPEDEKLPDEEED